ncbi:MAG: hypothetical protein ACFCU3_08420 [Verrucomicrobiales bacterium]
MLYPIELRVRFTNFSEKKYDKTLLLVKEKKRLITIPLSAPLVLPWCSWRSFSLVLHCQAYHITFAIAFAIVLLSCSCIELASRNFSWQDVRVMAKAPNRLKKRTGCFTRLFQLFFFLVVVLALGLAGTAWWAAEQIRPLLSDTARDFPDRPIPDEELLALQQRVAAYRAAAERDEEAELRITDREINGMIAADAGWANLRGKMFTRIQDDRLFIFSSVPTSEVFLAKWLLKDKHANITMDISPKLDEGLWQMGWQKLWMDEKEISDFSVWVNGVESALNHPRMKTQLQDILGKTRQVLVEDGALVFRTLP